MSSCKSDVVAAMLVKGSWLCRKPAVWVRSSVLKAGRSGTPHLGVLGTLILSTDLITLSMSEKGQQLL